MREKIFVGRRFPANHKIVWGSKRSLFLLSLRVTDSINRRNARRFSMPTVWLSLLPVPFSKIQEEKDLDEFKERVKRGNISWNEAKVIASLESIRHMSL